MHLSLVGMSLIGKSYWSTKLEGIGFRRFCCDDLIEQRLARDLEGPDGRRLSMGEWMGFPYESRYRPREGRYLKLENEVLQAVLAEVETCSSEENLVIDTTGSVIYLRKELLQEMRKRTLVVHLTAPSGVQEEIAKNYFSDPTPMIWNDHFVKSPRKTDEESLIASYPKILASREIEYQKVSHVALDYFMLRQSGLEASDLLGAIRKRAAR